MSGNIIGHYQIQSQIGRGGMATVYRALDTQRGRTVALKVLHPHLASDDIVLRRFGLEGETGRKLQHPNIVPVYDAGESDGFHYIVMRYVPHGTLADRLGGSERPMSPDETVAIIEQAADALAYAHDIGVLHRDVKPNNVLLDDRGYAMLADFGVARPMVDDYSLSTLPGTTVGTPAYMSPEQARGDHQIDQRSDVYSLGVVAYAMLTGHLPFEGESHLTLLQQIVEETPPAANEINRDVPEGMAYALQRVLAKRPRHRYATATEFADALAHGRTWTPASAEMKALARMRQREALARPDGTPPARSRRSARAGFAVVAFLTLLALLLWAVFQTLDDSLAEVIELAGGHGNAPDTPAVIPTPILDAAQEVTGTAEPEDRSTPASHGVAAIPLPSEVNTETVAEPQGLQPSSTSIAEPTAYDKPTRIATSTPIPAADDVVSPPSPVVNTIEPSDVITLSTQRRRTPMATSTPVPDRVIAPRATIARIVRLLPTATADSKASLVQGGPTSVQLLTPSHGFSSIDAVVFSWESDRSLMEGQVFELVFWRPTKGENQYNGRAWDAATASTKRRLVPLEEGDFLWGIWLGAFADDGYVRIRYLGGERAFSVRSSSGSDGASGVGDSGGK